VSERHVLHDRVTQDVTYHAPDQRAIAAHQAMREAVAHVAHLAVEVCPEGRELSLGLTALIDNTLAHFNASIARNHDRLRDPAEWKAPEG
jgi:hypothetical protein